MTGGNSNVLELFFFPGEEDSPGPDTSGQEPGGSSPAFQNHLEMLL